MVAAVTAGWCRRRSTTPVAASSGAPGAGPRRSCARVATTTSPPRRWTCGSTTTMTSRPSKTRCCSPSIHGPPVHVGGRLRGCRSRPSRRRSVSAMRRSSGGSGGCPAALVRSTTTSSRSPWRSCGPIGSARTASDSAARTSPRARRAAVRWLEEAGVDPLAGVPAAIGAVLRRAHELGRLEAGSDPLAALLEPLQAHYGITPVPEAHVCACFAPHDPSLPPGHRLLQVWTGQLVHACRPEPIDAIAAGRARAAFLDQVGPRTGAEPRGEDDVPCLLGSIWGPPAVGPLWVFGDPYRPGRYDNLFLDNGGTPYIARPDRRHSEGYRWEQESPSFVFGRWCPNRRTAPTGVA